MSDSCKSLNVLRADDQRTSFRSSASGSSRGYIGVGRGSCPGNFSKEDREKERRKAREALRATEGKRDTVLDRVPSMTVGILQKTFTELAGDHGAVHKEDIPAIFRAAGVKVPLEVEIDIIDTAPEYSSNLDGSFSLFDVLFFYCEHTQRTQTSAEDLVGKTAALLDEDGSGTIDASELAAWLQKLRMPISEDLAESFLQQADTDGSGTVEYSELILAMIQHGDVLTAAGRPPLPRDKE